jgi:hypothetical protein
MYICYCIVEKYILRICFVKTQQTFKFNEIMNINNVEILKLLAKSNKKIFKGVCSFWINIICVYKMGKIPKSGQSPKTSKNHKSEE